MPLDDLKATLDRSFADEMWSKDGMITPQAWDTGKAVVMEAGILKKDVAVRRHHRHELRDERVKT